MWQLVWQGWGELWDRKSYWMWMFNKLCISYHFYHLNVVWCIATLLYMYMYIQCNIRHRKQGPRNNTCIEKEPLQVFSLPPLLNQDYSANVWCQHVRWRLSPRNRMFSSIESSLYMEFLLLLMNSTSSSFARMVGGSFGLECQSYS